MGAVESVAGLRGQVTAKTAELHALQRQLLVAEREKRTADLQVLADSQGATAGRHGMVIQQGRQPEATIARGFPTSRSEIQGDRATPVMLNGSAQVESDAVAVFQIPRSIHAQPGQPAPPTTTGESGKGPALVKLFG